MSGGCSLAMTATKTLIWLGAIINENLSLLVSLIISNWRQHIPSIVGLSIILSTTCMSGWLCYRALTHTYRMWSLMKLKESFDDVDWTRAQDTLDFTSSELFTDSTPGMAQSTGRRSGLRDGLRSRHACVTTRSSSDSTHSSPA